MYYQYETNVQQYLQSEKKCESNPEECKDTAESKVMIGLFICLLFSQSKLSVSNSKPAVHKYLHKYF